MSDIKGIYAVTFLAVSVEVCYVLLPILKQFIGYKIRIEVMGFIRYIVGSVLPRGKFGARVDAHGKKSKIELMRPIQKILRIYPIVTSNITILFCQVIKKVLSSTSIK